MAGWIKLHRKFLKWEWFNDNNMVMLFIYLLLKANFETSKWKGIEVKRGQLITGINSLSQQTRVSLQSIRTVLKRLKSTGEITIQSTNKYSIITICNYDSYQIIESDTNKPANRSLTNEQQTTNKQLTTYKNNKNGKEGKYITKPKDVEMVISYFQEKNCQTASLEANKFWDYFSSNGWKVGNKAPMKDWKAAVNNWIRNIKSTKVKTEQHGTIN